MIPHYCLKNAKAARVELGGDNEHRDQCNGIPESLTTGLGYHRECYKKFTYANALLKRKKKNVPSISSTLFSSASSSHTRRSTETDSAGRFPLYCMKCKKVTLKYKINGKSYIEREPAKMTLKSAEKKWKLAAKLRNDSEMLSVVDGVDLCVKDFRKHAKCYNDYTKIVSNLSRKNSSKLKKTRTVDREVFDEGKFCTLDSLIKLNGNNPNKNLRRLLKFRLKRKYGQKLLFLTAEHNHSQVVCSVDSFVQFQDGEKPLADSVPTNVNIVIKKALNY